MSLSDLDLTRTPKVPGLLPVAPPEIEAVAPAEAKPRPRTFAEKTEGMNEVEKVAFVGIQAAKGVIVSIIVAPIAFVVLLLVVYAFCAATGQLR